MRSLDLDLDTMTSASFCSEMRDFISKRLYFTGQPKSFISRSTELLVAFRNFQPFSLTFRLNVPASKERFILSLWVCGCPDTEVQSKFDEVRVVYLSRNPS